MQDIEHTLKTRIENDETNTFVVIVPTDSVRLHRQRELINYHPNKAVANLQVYTNRDFVQRLYSRAYPSKRSISQGLQNLWVHEIANARANDTEPYPYESFRPNQEGSVPDSTLSVIVDTINRLRERGETAQRVEDTINRLGEHDDIVAGNPAGTNLVHIYAHYETRLEERWIDEQGKRFYLANNFDTQFMKDAFPRVNLVVVEGFTVLSKADIEILTRIAGMHGKKMWFRTDWLEGNENLYKNITDLLSQFTDANAHIDPDYEREPDRHQHFAENLFRADATSTNLNHNADDPPQITVLKPTDRSEEVEEIARRIQKHVLKKHCSLNDICVAYYNIGQYQQRIAEIFPAYGIPYSLAETVPLTKSEVVKSIFSRLSSDRTPLNDTYFSTVEPVSDTQRFHPSEFQEYAEGLLKKGEVIQRILNPMFGRSPEVVEAEVEAYRQFDRVLKELCSVLMSEGITSDFLNNYIEKLHRVAKHTNYRNRATPNGEVVRIVQLSELRSQEFDTVFLGDFVDGSFPENYRPDPLLPEIPYRTEDEQLHDNRFMFYRVLKSFRNRLYLLVPQREREAELIPSPFLQQLKAVTKIKEVEEINDSMQGSIPSFLSTYGKHVWAADTPLDGIFPKRLEHMRPLIKHVVEVEKSREEIHDLLDYEGVLTAGSLSTQSQERLESLRRERYSVTELETYANCPFQYLARRVLNLRVEEDEEGDELSSLGSGSLLHDVLREFCSNRKKENKPPIGGCGDDDFKDAKQQLDAILKSVSEEHRHQRNQRIEFPVSEDNLFWEMDIEKLRVRLHKWIEAERTSDLSVMPCYYEVPFRRERDPRNAESDGAVRLIGTIDRIDVDSQFFNIVDYKTGNAMPKIREVREGRALQLPIYLKMAREWLSEHETLELEQAGALYYKIRLDQFTTELGIGKKSLNGIGFKNHNGTKWGTFGSRNGQLLEDEYFPQILERVSGYVQQYVESISKGNFPLITRVKTFSPPEKDGVVETDEYGFVDDEKHGNKPLTPRNKTQPCSYCAYKRVCRVGAVSEDSQSDD